MDSFQFDNLVDEKVQALRKNRAQKEQDYFYNKQKEQMTEFVKQSLINQQQPIPETIEGKAPQGVVPYLDPNQPTRMNVTDLFGKGTDADSIWGLTPENTYYDVGLRADTGINTAEHAAYNKAGAQDQLKKQRIYFGMLRGIFPKDVNPIELSDDELREFVPDQMIFDIGTKAEELSRAAALEGWQEGEIPQVDISYDPMAQKHIGDERVRGMAVNPRTGVNIHDAANLPEYNINWFSKDPRQTKIREAYEKKYGSDYSRFKSYNKAQVQEIADGRYYTVTNLHTGAMYPDVSKPEAERLEKAIQSTSAPLDKVPTDKYVDRVIESFINSSTRLNYQLYPQGHRAEDTQAFAVANPAFDTGDTGIDVEPISLKDVLASEALSARRLADTEKEYRRLTSEAIGKHGGLAKQFLYTLKNRKADAFESLLDSSALMAELSMGAPGIAAAISDSYVRIVGDYIQENPTKNESNLTAEEKSILAGAAAISTVAEKIGLNAMLGKTAFVKNAVTGLTAKSGVLGKTVSKVLGYGANVGTEGVTGIISEQAEKTGKGVAAGKDIQDTALTGSEALEAFQMEAMGAGGPAAVSSSIEAATNFTNNQMLNRISKEINELSKVQEFTPITEQQAKIQQSNIEKQQAKLVPGLPKEKATAIREKIAKSRGLLDQGKINPEFAKAQERIKLLQERATLIQDKIAKRNKVKEQKAAAKAEKQAAKEAEFKAAEEAAPAAESASTETPTTDRTAELLAIARNRRLDAEEATARNIRQQASEKLSAQVTENKSAEAAQAVLDLYEETSKDKADNETKLNSLANIIDPDLVVESNDLSDKDMKDVNAAVQAFNDSNTAKQLEEASQMPTGAADVSANILNESRANFTSIKDHIATILAAIKSKDLPSARPTIRKLQRFSASHKSKNQAVINAKSLLDTVPKDGVAKAVVLTRTVNPKTKVAEYSSSEIMDLLDAQNIVNDKEAGTNKFFVANNGISDNFTKAIGIEAKFVAKALKLGNVLDKLAKNIEDTNAVSEAITDAVPTASDLLNKEIPETKSTTTTSTTPKETTDGLQEEKGKQETTNEEVKPSKRAPTPPESKATPLDKIMVEYDITEDGSSTETEISADKVNKVFQTRINRLSAVAERILNGTC